MTPSSRPGETCTTGPACATLAHMLKRTYVKPRLRHLGLLRLLTRFSF
jgi:hypothetical protein